jgi:hypothetical protein
MSAKDRHERYLEIQDHTGKMKRFFLGEKSSIVGRSADADLTLESTDVSRKHAEFAPNDLGQWSVRDMASRNGSSINGRKLDPTGENDGWNVLEPGDRVNIGDFALIFSMGTPALDWALGHEVSLINVDESDSPPAISLSDAKSAQIDARQLDAIAGLGMQMVQIADAPKRLAALCQFLLASPMKGLAAIALRLSKEPPTAEPRALSQWTFCADWNENQKVHISRTALLKILATGDPVLAGSGLSEQTVAMSITPDSPMAVMACPLYSDDKLMDLLYIAVQPTYATADYLAVTALAVQQYMVGQVAAQLRYKS